MHLSLLTILLMLAGCMPGGNPSTLEFKEKSSAPEIPNDPVSKTTDDVKSLDAFKQTVYPIVRSHTCLNCHSADSKGQSPTFADTDPIVAFNSITMSRKVDLTSPESSRVVLKLKNESHNCWSANCAADAQEMLEAIRKWVELSPQTSTSDGISTDSQKMPADSTAIFAQTEYGTLLLQAEQPGHRSEVVQGRFSDQQDSLALEGKYLQLTPVETNPITNAPRNLSFDSVKFDACREFVDSDLAPGSRALKIVQQRVHIPSGEKNEEGKIVNDGYRPYTAGLAFQIIRPEKRLEYAKMIYNAKYTSALDLVFKTGAPAATTSRVEGQKVADTFQGTPLFFATPARILPHFTDWASVFNADGTYKTSGTFTKDDGTQEGLYYLFKDGAYGPDDSVIQTNLMIDSHYKKDLFYKRYKESIVDMFYKNGIKVASSSYKHPYNQFVNADVATYFYPEVSVELKCPAGVTCTKSDMLKFHITQSGTLLTQGNALNCYTLNEAQTQIISVASSNCNGVNPKFFHYIDLFVRPVVTDPFLPGTQTVYFYSSSTPNSFIDLETFTEDRDKRLVFHKDQDAQELDPDVFFTAGASAVSEADNIKNFTATLHNTLKSTRCVDCHGNPNSQAPQFGASNATSAYSALKSGGYINFDNPRSSFRPNGMIHNCDVNSTDPRYSCAEKSEEALRNKLVSAINSWKQANIQTAQDAGSKPYRSLSKDERLPGRAKYTFKVTTEGLYNVWMKLKNVSSGSALNFRILDSNGVAVAYTRGDSTTLSTQPCFKWAPKTTTDFWEWSTPGREQELATLDQRGYILLNDQKQPLALANQRAYFRLAEGVYTLDVIGLSENLRLDAVGVNHISDFKPDSRLMFQPDRRAIDEKNISDYRRKILRFDLSSKLGLAAEQKAFFEIEVKKQFGGQNFIFRNPRFITEPRTFNVEFKGIKVFINGKWNSPDATYNNLSAITGDNKVLTYAPLIALTSSENDFIHFQFDKLAVTTEGLSTIDPKGSTVAAVEDRRCADLDYFVKNVKPILFDVKVTLTDEYIGRIRTYPGTPREAGTYIEPLNCVSCHTKDHPYFKISNFSNNEELCREALSRVDFQNFYQSLVVRRINGTGNHPKFVFIEKLETGSDDNFKKHDKAQDYMLNRYVAQSGFAAIPVPGPRMVWSKEDMGITKQNYTDLTAQEKLQVVKAGMFRRMNVRTVNMDVVNYSWYVPEIHHALLHNVDDSSLLDNNLSAFDVISPNPAIGKLYPYRNRGPLVYDIMGLDENGIPFATDYGSRYPTPYKSSFKLHTPNAELAYDKETLDHISMTPEIDSIDNMWSLYEVQRDYYREKVINWIRRENEARLNGN